MTDKVTPTRNDEILAEALLAMFDKPLPIDLYEAMQKLIARHASQARAEGMLMGARLGLKAAATVCGKTYAASAHLFDLGSACAENIRALSPEAIVKGDA